MSPVVVTCSVCGDRVGKGPNGLGIRRHAMMHRRQFHELVGEWPGDYQEVRDLLGDDSRFTPGAQIGLDDVDVQNDGAVEIVQATLGGPFE